MRIPVTILAGFLGSGKTTRLNALLHGRGRRRVAVVLNELGQVGVDAARLAGAEEFVELDGGCLCCVLNADLERALVRLHERAGFEHVVIETTGIADPLAVAWTIERPGLRERYRVDAIAVVVDALHLRRALATAPEAALQIERADVLLVSKLDLVDGGLDAVEAQVRPLNPVAPLLVAPPDAPPWDLLVDPAREALGNRAAEPSHTHPSAWDVWRFETVEPLAEASLEAFLRRLPAGVYRVKGLVRTAGDPAWLEVHAVGGRYEIAPGVPPPSSPTSTLLCIGRALDRDALDAAAAGLRAASSA